MGKRSKELGFIRDTLEKVTRLADVLEYFSTNPVLRRSLALKGGTAINLTIFNLPRLSVDIDLDYLITDSKEEMLKNRELINALVDRYMISQGYQKSDKTKTPHSLDSFVYDYINGGGNKDSIKLEINYSIRAHIYPAEEREITAEHFPGGYMINCITPIEIFGSKINALLNRAAARDLYDVSNMIQFRIFDESEGELLKKSVIFYAAISSEKVNKFFNVDAIDNISKQKIKTDLWPVLRKGDNFNLDFAKSSVRKYIQDLMVLSKSEFEFLERFENKEYKPELLFQEPEILDRIRMHPMALWKIRQ